MQPTDAMTQTFPAQYPPPPPQARLPPQYHLHSTASEYPSPTAPDHGLRIFPEQGTPAPEPLPLPPPPAVSDGRTAGKCWRPHLFWGCESGGSRQLQSNLSSLVFLAIILDCRRFKDVVWKTVGPERELCSLCFGSHGPSGNYVAPTI